MVGYLVKVMKPRGQMNSKSSSWGKGRGGGLFGSKNKNPFGGGRKFGGGGRRGRF